MAGVSLHSYVHYRNIQDRMCSGPLFSSVNVTWWCAESMDFVADAPEGRAGPALQRRFVAHSPLLYRGGDAS